MAAKLWNMLKLIPSIPASRKNSMITGLARIDENSDELILSLYNLPDPADFLDAKSGTYYAWFYESQDNKWKKIGELQRKNGLTFSLRKRVTVNGDGVFITAEEKNREPKEPGNVILSSNPELFYRDQIENPAEFALPVEKGPVREIMNSKVEEQARAQSPYAIVKNDRVAETPAPRPDTERLRQAERAEEAERVRQAELAREAERVRQAERAEEAERVRQAELAREAEQMPKQEAMQAVDITLEMEKIQQPLGPLAIGDDYPVDQVRELAEDNLVDLGETEVRDNDTQDEREETEDEEAPEVREEERTISPHASYTGKFEGGKQTKVSDYTYDATREVPAGSDTTERLKRLLNEFYNELPSDEMMGVVKNRYQLVKTELDLKAYWEKIKQYAMIFYEETRLKELVDVISRDLKYLVELIGLDDLWDRIERFIREVIRLIDIPDWVAKVKGWIQSINIAEWYLTVKRYINAILAEIDPIVLWNRLRNWIESLLERMNIDDILNWIKLKICELRTMTFEEFKAECGKLLNQLVDALKMPELKLAVIKVTVKDKFAQMGAFFQKLKGREEETPAGTRPTNNKRDKSATGWNDSLVNQYYNPHNYTFQGMGTYTPATAVASTYTFENPYLNQFNPYDTMRNMYVGANQYIPMAQAYALAPYVGGGNPYSTMQNVSEVNPYLMPASYPATENYAAAGQTYDQNQYSEKTPYANHLTEALSNLYTDPLIFRPAMEEPASQMNTGLYEAQRNAVEQTLWTEPAHSATEQTPYQCPFLQWPDQGCGCNFKVSHDAVGDPRYVYDGRTDKYFFITPDGEITSR